MVPKGTLPLADARVRPLWGASPAVGLPSALNAEPGGLKTPAKDAVAPERNTRDLAQETAPALLGASTRGPRAQLLTPSTNSGSCSPWVRTAQSTPVAGRSALTGPGTGRPGRLCGVFFTQQWGLWHPHHSGGLYCGILALTARHVGFVRGKNATSSVLSASGMTGWRPAWHLQLSVLAPSVSRRDRRVRLHVTVRRGEGAGLWPPPSCTSLSCSLLFFVVCFFVLTLSLA